MVTGLITIDYGFILTIILTIFTISDCISLPYFIFYICLTFINNNKLTVNGKRVVSSGRSRLIVNLEQPQ